jgi:hypothetical protein
MSSDVKICPRCNKRTLEPTLECVVPLFNGSDSRVMPYFCMSCRCVELYPVGVTKTADPCNFREIEER